MKKIVGLFTLAACVVFSLPAGAKVQDRERNKTVKIEKQRNFYPVDEKEAPPVLVEALNRRYNGCVLQRVYVSNNTTFVKYKVVLLTPDRKVVKVYLDDRGNVIKEHPYFI